MLGRLKAVLLCMRYVDIMDFGAWFVLLGVQQKKSRSCSKTKALASLFVFLGGHIASRADDTANIALSPRRAPPQQSSSPRGWYSPVP